MSLNITICYCKNRDLSKNLIQKELKVQQIKIQEIKQNNF